MTTLLLVLVVVAVSMALLSVRLFFGKAFVKTHIHQSKAMGERGIGCVKEQDKGARHSSRQGVAERRPRIPANR